MEAATPRARGCNPMCTRWTRRASTSASLGQLDARCASPRPSPSPSPSPSPDPDSSPWPQP
eukprot:scaffold127305_cov45-Phaeocystis_antarctica.AAC.2